MNIKRSLAVVTGVAAFAMASVSTAFAGILEDSDAAITSAGTDALTVGGYVVAAVGSLIVVGLILGMMRKL